LVIVGRQIFSGAFGRTRADTAKQRIPAGA
jgi:hypothetical protein